MTKNTITTFFLLTRMVASQTVCDTFVSDHSASCCASGLSDMAVACPLAQFLPRTETSDYSADATLSVQLPCASVSATFQDMKCCPSGDYNATPFACFDGSLQNNYLSSRTITVAQHYEPAPPSRDDACQQIVLGFASDPSVVAGYTKAQRGAEDALRYLRTNTSVLGNKCLQALYMDHYYKPENYVAIMSEFMGNPPPYVVAMMSLGSSEMSLDMTLDGYKWSTQSSALVAVAGLSSEDGLVGNYNSQHPFYNNEILTSVNPQYGDPLLESGTYSHAFTASANNVDMAEAVLKHMVDNKCPSDRTIENPCILEWFVVTAVNGYGLAAVNTAKSVGTFTFELPREQDVYNDSPAGAGQYDSMVCSPSYAAYSELVTSTFTQQNLTTNTNSAYSDVHINVRGMCALGWTIGDLSRADPQASAIYLHTYGGDATFNLTTDNVGLADKVYVHSYFEAQFMSSGVKQVSAFSMELADNAFGTFMRAEDADEGEMGGNYFLGVNYVGWAVAAMLTKGLDNTPMSRTNFRDTFETMDVTDELVASIGLEGNVRPIKCSSNDHKCAKSGVQQVFINELTETGFVSV